MPAAVVQNLRIIFPHQCIQCVCVPGLGVKLQVLGTKLLPHKTVMNIWMRQQKH